LVCVNVGSGVGLNTGNGTTSLAYTLNVTFGAPISNPNSLLLQTTITTPVNVRSNPSYRQYISIGQLTPGYGPRLTPGFCNNMGFESGIPPLSIPYNSSTLTSYLITWLSAHSDLNFDASSSYGPILLQALGNITTSTIVPSIVLDSTKQYLKYSVSFDLTMAAYYCPSGVVITTGANGYDKTYAVTLIVSEQNAQGGWAHTQETYMVVVLGTGVVEFIGSGKYYEQIDLNEIIVSNSFCTNTSQSAMEWSVIIEFHNVYDPTVNVGPRFASDISFKSPQSTGVTNCYGDSIVSITTLPCVDAVCYTLITAKTKCRALVPNGQAFNQCMYANLADMILDMGSNTPYPVSLNQMHTFFVNVWSCPITNLNSSTCFSMNRNPPYPDQFQVNISVVAYPNAPTVTTQFAVQLCLLPTPTSPASACTFLSTGYSNGSMIKGQDLSNAQISNDKALSPYIQFVSSALRNSIDLRMTNFTIYPVNSAGIRITGVQPVTPVQVNVLLLDVYKNRLSFCPSCQVLTAVENTIGSDGWSISPVSNLETILPATGFDMIFQYAYSWPVASSTSLTGTLTPASRRLLGIDNSNTQAQTQAHNKTKTVKGTVGVRIFIVQSIAFNTTLSSSTGTMFNSSAAISLINSNVLDTDFGDSQPVIGMSIFFIAFAATGFTGVLLMILPSFMNKFIMYEAGRKHTSSNSKQKHRR
jgi:hypothetical protein